MTGAAALIAATSLLAKVLGQGVGSAVELHPFQVSAGRFAFGFMSICVFLLVSPGARPRLAGARWRLHVLRSVIGWLGVSFTFAAAAKMALAEATSISFLSPLVTMALAVTFLGESIGLRKVVATLLAILGAYIILRPGTDAFQPAGLFALAAACTMGTEAILIKRLTETESTATILFINNALGALVSLPVAVAVWQWPEQAQWGLLALLGALMVSGQALFVGSMRLGQASLVIPAFYTVLVFAAAYDFLVFSERPTIFALTGAALIVAGAVILTLRTRY